MKKLISLLALFASALLFSACESGALVLDPEQATVLTDEENNPDADSVEPSDTGITEPDGDTGTHEPDGDTGTTEPDGDTGTTEPDGDTGTTEPDGDTGTTEPDGDTGTTEPDGDTGTTEPDGDTGTTEPDGDTGTTEPDDDTGDTEPGGDTGDTEPGGDTGDTEPDGDIGDTVTPEPTPAEICADNGGIYSAGSCTKEVSCGALTETNTEWNKGGTATLTFDFESEEWSAAASPSYNDAGGVCTYKCEAGTRREDNACKNLCSVRLNGTNSYIFLDNDPRSLFDTDMWSEWTIEFWYKQDSLPTFSQSTSTPPVLRRGGNGVSSPSFEIYPVGTYTRYGGTRRYLYTTVTTNMTYSVMGFGRTEEYTATYEKQVSTLPSYNWVHVALTGKSTVSGSYVQSADITLNLYVNGVKVATKEEDNISSSKALKLASVNDGLYVGYNGSRYFNGLVSGLRISKAVLYNGSFTPSADLAADTNTLESWKFDHETIMKLVGSAEVPESDLHNIEWSTDCPGN